MTHRTHLVAFGHPTVEEGTRLANELIDQGARIAAEVGNTQPSNALSTALQSVVQAAVQRDFTFAEVLAGLAGASAWLLTTEREADIRAAIVETFGMTILESCRRGIEAETRFSETPEGTVQ